MEGRKRKGGGREGKKKEKEREGGGRREGGDRICDMFKHNERKHVMLDSRDELRWVQRSQDGQKARVWDKEGEEVNE